MVADLTGLIREIAKIINLGLMYGMGLEKLALSLGITAEAAADLLETYHGNMPWLKGLTDYCAENASERGYIRLIDHARCHFDLWEPNKRGQRYKGAALPLARAQVAWPDTRLKRAGTHKAFNRLIQGSAARQTKMAMVTCYREGILPLIQMHDELGASIGKERTGIRMAEIMRDAVKLRVPVKVDLEYGRNWGDATHSWKELMAA